MIGVLEFKAAFMSNLELVHHKDSENWAESAPLTRNEENIENMAQASIHAAVL